MEADVDACGKQQVVGGELVGRGVVGLRRGARPARRVLDRMRRIQPVQPVEPRQQGSLQSFRYMRMLFELSTFKNGLGDLLNEQGHTVGALGNSLQDFA